MDAKLKYLEMLQGVIARMAGNSFLLKTWSVGLGTALIGLSARDANAAFAVVAILPVGCFWALDAYYLALERRFRNLFNQALEKPDASFQMNPGPLCNDQWRGAARSRAVIMIHLPVIVLSVVVALISVTVKIAGAGK